MFERVIAQTIQRITSETLQERPSISLIEILEDERIPARLKPFFETEVHWWLYNENLARAANKRFNYEHPELASLLNYLEQVQFRHARFEREDFLTVLDSAVKLTYNFLCRPRTTLKWYIFRGQPVRPLQEVMLRFGAFSDYDYFRNVFAEWVERKQHERPTFDGISSTEFERIIRRIDDQILLNCTVEDLLGIIYPIFEFIGEGGEMVVPIDALIIFFDDKNIKRLVDHLERARELGRDVVGRDDFVSLLDELLSSADDEPETDFSNVYQNDELDDVVRRHLNYDGRPSEDEPPAMPEASAVPQTSTLPEAPAMPEPAVMPEPVAMPEPAAMADASATPEPSDAPDSPTMPVTSPLPDSTENPIATSQLPVEDLPQIVREPEVELSNEAAPPWIEEEAVEQPAASEPEASTTPELQSIPPSTEDAAKDQAQPQPEPPAPHDDAPAPEPAPGTIGAEIPSVPSVPPELHLNGRLAGTYQSAPEGELEDVRRFIDPLLERKVVKRVFQKSREEYEAALENLNAADTWRAASKVLDELFVRFEVDPYSRTAIRFTDSVYGRYLPKSQHS
jgi:hypothetical protein